MFIPPAILQSPSAEGTSPCQRDLAAFDVELDKRRADFATAHLSIERQADAKLILAHLFAMDQFVRSQWLVPNAHGYGSTPAEQAFFTAMQSRNSAVDAENLSIFKALLDRWGWFDRTTWGDKADNEAWTLAQHADGDLPFQKRVLTLLEPLVATGKTNPSTFALLYDRVAVNDHRLQRFGTQGYCTGPGAWTPRPIEDPTHVDERREAMGLEPLADYIASFKGICHEDQTARALKTTPLPDK